MKKYSSFVYYLAALLNAVLIGFSFLIIKIGFNYANTVDLLAHRFTFAMITIAIFYKLGFIQPSINRRAIKDIAPLAVFFPLLFFGLQAIGLQDIQSSEAGIIYAVGPIFTMILAALILSEKTSLIQKLSIGLSVFGVLYIAFKAGSTLQGESLTGIIFVTISVFSLSIYNVLAKSKTYECSTIDIIVIITTIGFIVFNIIAIVTHIMNGSLLSFLNPLLNWQFLLAIFYLGALSTFLTSFLTVFALSQVEAYKISVFSNLSTIISILAGVVFLNESIHSYHIVGSLLIVGGVLGANLLGRKKQ